MGDDDLLISARAIDGMKLLAIVRRLAERGPVTTIVENGGQCCEFCHRISWDGDLHAPDCLWQNARELLDAQA